MYTSIRIIVIFSKYAIVILIMIIEILNINMLVIIDTCPLSLFAEAFCISTIKYGYVEDVFYVNNIKLNC